MTATPPDLLTNATGTWTLDPTATTIQLRTKAMWVLPVKATFTATEGSGTVTPDGQVSGSFVVNAASIDTGNAGRDKHLLTRDFFEVETYPTFTYAATSVVPAADGTFAVTGSLTIHGKTRPLDLVAKVAPHGADTVTVSTEAALDRSQWDIDWTKMGANLHNQISVTAAFLKA